MAFTKGPYFHRSSLPTPARPVVHSSRKIDFATGRYVLNKTTGGNEGMKGVAQRVVLGVALAERDLPDGVIDDASLEEREDAIRRELEPLTDGPEPAILLDLVETESAEPGSISTNVDYRDTNEQADESAQLT